MFMSTLAAELDDSGPAMSYPALAGKRVLITGVTSTRGVDIVRAFAEHKTELVVEMAEQSEAMQALAEIAAQSALDLTIIDNNPRSEAEILAMARRSVATYGGIDTVVNLIAVAPETGTVPQSLEAVEAMISKLFLKACLIGRVAANRMRMLQTQGVVLNVGVTPPGQAHQGFINVARATLAAMTRGEAETWARDGIRFNAVSPAGLDTQRHWQSDLPAIRSEPDVADLALFLATGRGKSLSGVTFDAESA